MGVGDKLVEAAKEAKKAGGEEKKEPTVEKLYLLGVDAYKNGDYKTAIDYFNQVLTLDPTNKEAKDGLKRAQQLLKGVPKKEKRSEAYLRGVEAYANENYDVAAAYFQLALPTDGEAARGNLKKAQEMGGDVDAGMAALKLQNLPPPLMQMVIAYYKEKGKSPQSKSVKEESKQEEKKPSLFASGKEYEIYVNNENIDRKERVGKTNLHPYEIKEKFERGEETNWEEIIMKKCKDSGGTYIGALVNKQGEAEGVFYIADGVVYFLTWRIERLNGDYVLHTGQWLKFETTRLNGNGAMGIYVKKK